MRKSHVFLALAAIAIGPFPAMASPFSDAATYLDGVWRGDNYILRIDAARAQASAEPERPFEWARFIVKEATEEEIVFTIGAELFQARLGPEGIFLQSTSFRGERLMQRDEPIGELLRR